MSNHNLNRVLVSSKEQKTRHQYKKKENRAVIYVDIILLRKPQLTKAYSAISSSGAGPRQFWLSFVSEEATYLQNKQIKHKLYTNQFQLSYITMRSQGSSFQRLTPTHCSQLVTNLLTPDGKSENEILPISTSPIAESPK